LRMRFANQKECFLNKSLKKQIADQPSQGVASLAILG